MENLLKNLEELREKVIETMAVLEVERKRARVHELRAEMGRPGFWDDQERAVKISRQAEDLDKEASEWEALSADIRELEEFVAVGQEEGDESIYGEAEKNYLKLKEKFEKLEFFVMFSGKYDASNAIVSVKAGSGGVDAQDWAEMLERMILRFCEKKEWKIEMIDRSVGGEAGIKGSHFRIVGRWAYGFLRSESGTHRLVRISPFDAEAMRHTSFAMVEVIPELPETEEVEIPDADIKIDVYKSSGPGGQGVNTTDSAVRITHKPTGITVSCQNERSQHQNRETAMNILKSKIFKIREEEREKKEAELRGDPGKAEWGNQIRSYVMQPYKMVKDHRTNFETQDVDGVLDGNLEGFVEAFLRREGR